MFVFGFRLVHAKQKRIRRIVTKIDQSKRWENFMQTNLESEDSKKSILLVGSLPNCISESRVLIADKSVHKGRWLTALQAFNALKEALS